MYRTFMAPIIAMLVAPLICLPCAANPIKIACGAHRDQGPEHAHLGIVNDADIPVEDGQSVLYVDGKKVRAESVGVPHYDGHGGTNYFFNYESDDLQQIQVAFDLNNDTNRMSEYINWSVDDWEGSLNLPKSKSIPCTVTGEDQ
ncbi:MULTISPECIES: hypothetical protein [unclassified Mesorhizobium]|uniref:hypothetical protein n=1 Tax=unclassified Mesorhizobium TaxID=325217 RepID=UPI001CC96D14|nr:MULTISPECIES: hypothetical protein [unclassified Mesorhizobium]MBZ9741023.1 hypothetical protein [Mesorhizobium sp. CO1-1-4]MBZ9804368.1 hypothetical protein [Mesorhizobium sp. ES1-6]